MAAPRTKVALHSCFARVVADRKTWLPYGEPVYIRVRGCMTGHREFVKHRKTMRSESLCQCHCKESHNYVHSATSIPESDDHDLFDLMFDNRWHLSSSRMCMSLLDNIDKIPCRLLRCVGKNNDFRPLYLCTRAVIVVTGRNNLKTVRRFCSPVTLTKLDHLPNRKRENFHNIGTIPLPLTTVVPS